LTAAYCRISGVDGSLIDQTHCGWRARSWKKKVYTNATPSRVSSWAKASLSLRRRSRRTCCASPRTSLGAPSFPVFWERVGSILFTSRSVASRSVPSALLFYQPPPCLCVSV